MREWLRLRWMLWQVRQAERGILARKRRTDVNCDARLAELGGGAEHYSARGCGHGVAWSDSCPRCRRTAVDVVVLDEWQHQWPVSECAGDYERVRTDDDPRP